MADKLQYLEITIADQDGVVQGTFTSKGLDLRRKLHLDTFMEGLDTAIKYIVAQAGAEYDPGLPSEEDK